MMRKIMKSPLGVALISTFVGFALTVLYDILKGKQILTTIAIVLKSIWSCIINFFNFDLKVWWVLVGIIAIVFILWIVAEISSTINEEPNFTKYTEDTIQGWKWKWYWKKNYYGKYEIENLHPVCDSCGTALAYKHDYQNNLYCVRCGRMYNSDKLPIENHIKIYIGDNVDRGLIPNSNLSQNDSK